MSLNNLKINYSNKERYIKKLNSYYFWGLLPLLVVIFIFIICASRLASLLFFLITFSWIYTLHVPYLDNYLQENKNRYSLLAIIFRIDQYLQKREYYYLTKYIPPISFVLIIYAITLDGNLLFAVFGTLYFELFYYLFRKYA